MPRSRLKTRTVTRRGDQPLVHENQEEGAEQEFVGHGIEVLADLGLLLEQPCGQAVEAVAKPCDHEETKRSSVVRLENRDDQKGYKAEAQESEQVGRCAQFFEQGCSDLRWLQPENLDGT